MALVPKDTVLEIVLDYLYNDEEVQEFIAYVQSEEFPLIHTLVEYLQQYKNVSAFMYMNLSLNLTEKLFVRFQHVDESLFSSV